MSKVKRIKEWLKIQMKNKKFVITTIVFLVLLIAVVFGLTISFSGILGSAYDVDSIGKNIDKIKIGDTINYTANGYSDWEVLNINKEDNTIDIVSKTSVEDLTIKVEDIDNYYDILQNTANKYMDGKYAVSARSVGENDAKKLDNKLGYWINKKADNVLYHSGGTAKKNTPRFECYIMPVVTVNIGDTTALNVGDIYTYSLNGVEQWVIFSIEDKSIISIVPHYPIWIEIPGDEIIDFHSYITESVEAFRDDKVISVRSISVEDKNTLCSISNVYDGNYYDIYTDVIYNGTTVVGGSSFGTAVNLYSYKPVGISIRPDFCGELDLAPSMDVPFGWTGGFVPVVTLKYDAPTKNSKDIDNKLKIGDYVNYTANGYKNWKVLDIDEENNTVDIISSGLVKNITLKGTEDYENLENILQTEVDKYKNGNNVVSARPVEIADLDNLKIIKDVQSAEFFLNNKKQYRKELSGDYIVNYVVSVGSYDVTISSLKYDWATLSDKNLYNENNPSAGTTNIFEYTAGLRPIITLKLSEAEESDDKEVVDNNSNLVEEQNRANQSSYGLISSEKLDRDEDEETLDDPIGSIEDETNKTTEEIRFLSESLEAVEKKTKYFNVVAVINLLSTIGVGVFSVFGRFRK